MPSGKCDQCGVDEYMPYVCKFCKGRFCAAHRLPENHGCAGLGAYRERVRAEGRPFASEPGTPLRPQVSRTARAGVSMDALWSKLDGRMTHVLLGIIIGVFILEWIVLLTAPALFDDIFVIQDDFLQQPWTILVSVFAHSPTSINHILFNGLVLLFFGQTTERLIGTRRFTYLFLGAGVLAGIAQIVLTQFLFPGAGGGALGASGAIQGIMGTLVVLAPRITVLVFFVIPAPLWALTIFYVMFDLLGVITPGSSVAHIAHLAGLAVGLAFGYYLRQRGLRAEVRQEPHPMKRYF